MENRKFMSNKLSCISRVKRTTNNRPPWFSDYVFEEFVGDRSGSMQSMRKEALDGTREFLTERRDLARTRGNTARLACTSFDATATTVFSKTAANVTNKEIEIAVKEMEPRGTTRLVDTVYERIKDMIFRVVSTRQKWTKEVRALNPKITLCIGVLTDGVDNESERPPTHLNQIIRKFENEYGGVAMFLAANQDAVENGGNMGFNQGHCIDFSADGEGISNALKSASAAMTRTSSGGSRSDTQFTDMERTQSIGVTHQLQRTPASMNVKRKLEFQSPQPRNNLVNLSLEDSDEDLDSQVGNQYDLNRVQRQYKGKPYPLGVDNCNWGANNSDYYTNKNGTFTRQ